MVWLNVILPPRTTEPLLNIHETIAGRVNTSNTPSSDIDDLTYRIYRIASQRVVAGHLCSIKVIPVGYA